MTNSDHRVTPHFQRRMRGLDAAEVYAYLAQLADQLQATESELSDTRAENERLRAESGRMRAELNEYEQAGDRVNDQVVQLLSQAQLVAEEMVEDVSRDARERIGQARTHERKIVDEALNTAGQQVRTYAATAQAQMQSIMESFASEVDRLGGASESTTPAAKPDRNDPLFDDLGDWSIPFGNGRGPGSPGSD
jgi:DivIVA domain-containing protein